MKYDSKVAEAIQGSIDKWIGIAYEGERDGGCSDCALCLMFHSSGCGDCPMDYAGHPCTGNNQRTPWKEWCHHPYQDPAIQMLDYLMHLAEWYELTADRS